MQQGIINNSHKIETRNYKQTKKLEIHKKIQYNTRLIIIKTTIVYYLFCISYIQNILLEKLNEVEISINL